MSHYEHAEVTHELCWHHCWLATAQGFSAQFPGINEPGGPLLSFRRHMQNLPWIPGNKLTVRMPVCVAELVLHRILAYLSYQPVGILVAKADNAAVFVH